MKMRVVIIYNCAGFHKCKWESLSFSYVKDFTNVNEFHYHMNTWTYEHMNIWIHEHMNTWTYEHMNIWTYEHMNIWTHEHMNTWTDIHMWKISQMKKCKHVKKFTNGKNVSLWKNSQRLRNFSQMKMIKLSVTFVRNFTMKALAWASYSYVKNFTM